MPACGSYWTLTLITLLLTWWTTRAARHQASREETNPSFYDLLCPLADNSSCGFGTAPNDSYCGCEEGFTTPRRSDLTGICSCSTDCQGEETKGQECDYNAVCTKRGRCKCKRGFKRKKKFCEDINECDPSFTNNCDAHAYCVNSDGSFHCVCGVGYTGNGEVCEDINECDNGKSCGEHAYCINAPGNFSCACRSGYKMNMDSFCTEIDECVSEPPVCDQNARCTNTLGSFECICNKGFVLRSGNICEDVDECENGVQCLEHEHCVNMQGSFTCRCDDGYANNSLTCQDIDECSGSVQLCDENARCTNKPGSFLCSCLDGYAGNGTVCQDIDECAVARSCNDHMLCENTAGGFDCFCEDGYFFNVTSCHDKDECSDGNYSCRKFSNCVNTNGSHKCICEGGILEDDFFCADSLLILVSAAVGAVVVPVLCVAAVRLSRKRRLSRNVTDKDQEMTAMPGIESGRPRDLRQQDRPQQLWSDSWNAFSQFSVNDLYTTYDRTTYKHTHTLSDTVTASTRLSSSSVETFSSFSTISDPSVPPTYANVV